MPTYLNEGPGSQIVTGTNGKKVPVSVGQTIETYEILSTLTLTDDAPYYNPVPADGVHAVSSTGVGDDQEVVISLDTDEIEIYNDSNAEITVFLRATANTPGLPVYAGSVRTISGTAGKVDKLVLQFTATGACTVVESK